MDEVSLGAGTKVDELGNNKIREYEIHPEDFDLQMLFRLNFKLSNAIKSKQKVLEALEDQPGATRDIVAINGGAVLCAAGVASSIADAWKKNERHSACFRGSPRTTFPQ